MAGGIEIAIVHGESERRSMSFVPGTPPARATIGASMQADWAVMAPGLDAIHVEIAWDGVALWVRDTGSSRGTKLDGAPITTGWHSFPPGHEVRAGRAMFRTTAIAAEHAPGGFDDDATQITTDAMMPPAVLPTPAAGARTGVASVGAGIPAPRVNSSATTGAHARAHTPSVVIVGPDASPSLPVLSVPDPFALPPAALTSGAPARPPVYAAPPIAHDRADPLAGTIPPDLALSVPPHNAPTATPLNSGRDVSDVFGDLPPPPPVLTAAQSARAGIANIPARTWLLAALTAIAGIGLIMMGSPPPPPVDPGHAVAVQVTDSPRAVTRYTPPVVAPSASPTGTLLAATMPAPPAPPDPRHPVAVVVPAVPMEQRPTRIAVDTLAQGRSVEAIRAFDALTVAHPEEPVYAQIGIVLRRKLERVQNPCLPGATTPCTQATVQGGVR